MLGVDELTQRRWRAQQARERLAETRRRALAEELLNHQRTVESDDGIPRDDWQAQVGKPMSAQQLMDKLKQCNPRLYFERSIKDPTKFGIYLIDPKGTYKCQQGMMVRHVMGMEAGMMPEFTVIHTVKVPVGKNLEGKITREQLAERPTTETYLDRTCGWRTVLVRLLHAGLITQYHVDKFFPLPSRPSKLWHDQTQ